MINRVLIRLKVIQIVYACNSSAESDAWAERELSKSLDSAFSLYNNLLHLFAEVYDYSRLVVSKKSQYFPENLHLSEKKFSENRLLAQLSENRTLKEYMESEHTGWMHDSGLVKYLYNQILESEALLDYAEDGVFDYEADRALCRKLYKTVFTDNEELDSTLEEQNLYWNGDKDLVDSFIVKTLKTFREENGAEQPLQPEYEDPADREFAWKLLKATLEGAEGYRSLIAANTRNWEAGRMALMDTVILTVGLAEITRFSDIPLKVSINEYVEASKFYSTPNSSGFVNGMLDTISKKLVAEGRLDK